MSYYAAGPASSQYPDSLFEEDWKNLGGDNFGLEAVAAFNAGFDFNQAENGACGMGIDPQLLSNASSPGSHYSTPLFNNDSANTDAFAKIESTDNATVSNNCPAPQDLIQVDPAATPYFYQSIELPNTDNDRSEDIADMKSASSDGPILTTYPAPEDIRASSPAAGPYFHPSIEMPNTAMQQASYIPSPLRNQLHRRSVSEPPAGIPDNFPFQYLPTNQMVTFHREGVASIGTPTMQDGAPARRTRSTTRHPNLQHPYPIAKQGAPERRPLRRAQTQPQGPTSVPSLRHAPSPPGKMIMQHPTMEGAPYTSSRVCTPAPSPQQEYIVASQVRFDSSHGLEPPEKKRAVAIPVSIEELRAMITDAVHVAFKGIAGTSKAHHPNESFNESGIVAMKSEG